jgi:hypothetical protein
MIARFITTETVRHHADGVTGFGKGERLKLRYLDTYILRYSLIRRDRHIVIQVIRKALDTTPTLGLQLCNIWLI